MTTDRAFPLLPACGLLLAAAGLLIPMRGARSDDLAAPLPPGVKAVWDLRSAWREATPTRERVCINGLWRWQPAGTGRAEVPSAGWCFLKVPACWPGITDYMQKDCQTVFAHPTWSKMRLGGVTAAWYEREIEVPAGWAGKRITLDLAYVNSLAAVYIDGKPAGEIRFPGGELDLTQACRPGGRHRLSLRVTALPLREVLLSYIDTANARQVQGRVERRGLCGDAYLVATPAGPRVADVKVETSVRQSRVHFDVALAAAEPGASYRLRARVSDGKAVVATFGGEPFTAADLKAGRASVSGDWRPGQLWDLHTAGNQYVASLALLDAQGREVDVAHDVRFGVREFWIDGRDFYLNGSRIYLSSVPLDNASVSALAASYAGARESLERLKGLGINMVYTHNYGCEPGSHLGFDEVLRAADDAGMLVSFSMPHFSHYEWKAADADRANGYAAHAAYYVRQAQNHPSVVFYSMSHNGTGYEEDMNPDLIDGLHDPREGWSKNNARLALRAEAIVKALDPGRVVYHHSSGNLGSMHTSNFYPNFTPVQELSDWFEHWATTGVKPVFTCEYGAPFTWDWAMYRGWYKGERTFGSAQVPWEFCLAEWDAQFLGDRAYRITPMEASNIRWEARQFREGRLWHRWDYPVELGSPRFDDRHTVLARYTTDNWRAFRTWGVSAISPWEHGHFWRAKPGVDRGRKTLPVDWARLQRPGFSPDYVGDQYERVDLALGRDDWVPAASGEALLRNNRPLLAYIAGKEPHFTARDHNALPGETLEKQLVVLNNARQTVACSCSWTLGLPSPVSGDARVEVTTGNLARVHVRVRLPEDIAPGTYPLDARFEFSNGERQDDRFAVHVLAPPTAGKGPVKAGVRVALFDPAGETRSLLKELGVAAEPVYASADLSRFDLLVIGKRALTPDGPAPRLDRVREGLKVVVFEQTTAALERRLGFRVTEYGLRQVFPRLDGHPALAGLPVESLADWRGEATILPPRLRYESRPRYGPTVRWNGVPVTRVWRCGNRGNVASVLVEKPARGDFRPVVDGGFSLQYSPLLEYREGRGMIVFCQLDVTGRSDPDPAARAVVRNVLGYAAGWNPPPTHTAAYVGNAKGLEHLHAAGFTIERLGARALTPDLVLVAAAGAGDELGGRTGEVASWLKAGGTLVAVGLEGPEASRFLPDPVSTKSAEHISAFFERPGAASPFAGVAPADVHVRDPRPLPLVSAGAEVLGDGVLAGVPGTRIVLCQVAPWEFHDPGKANLRRTYRRVAFLLSRLLANAGVPSSTPLLDRFATPVRSSEEARCLDGLYLDRPEEWDDPYRFFRW